MKKTTLAIAIILNLLYAIENIKSAESINLDGIM
jgi:hypothetical protein